MPADNRIMKALGAKLDRAAERLSFKDSNITIPATHTRKPIRSKNCSVITKDFDTEDVRVFVYKNYIVAVAHEALIRVFGTARSQADTLVLIEPKITTANTVCVFSSHSFWTSMDVPAGVTQEEGNTGFSIHLLSAVLALIFLARRIQPFLSLVDREVEFCVLTI